MGARRRGGLHPGGAWPLLLALVLTAAAGESPSRESRGERRRRGPAVSALRPGPLPPPPPECGPDPRLIFCTPEEIATAPSCDGFVGDPMFIHVGRRRYCRRLTPPPGHAEWLQAHPDACRPGEVRHSCLVAPGAGASCPEFSGPDYYRVYPLNAHGGHRGLDFVPDYWNSPARVELFYCRRLESIQAEEEERQRRVDEAFRQDLKRKLLWASALAGAALAAWLLLRSRRRPA